MKTIHASAPPEWGVHVIPGRSGAWCVLPREGDDAVSVHPSATQAERAAREIAHERGVAHVVIHDRYCRLHTVKTDDRSQEG